MLFNVRAHRMTIEFKLNWKRNRNLIVTLFSFTINIASVQDEKKKLSLCREKHVYMRAIVHVWVWLYVHAFQILFHLVTVWFRFSLHINPQIDIEQCLRSQNSFGHCCRTHWTNPCETQNITDYNLTKSRTIAKH